MTAQQFINKYNGQPVPGDNRYIGQCVDLAQLYSKEVVGWMTPFLGNAKDWWTNYNPKYFDKIPNTPTGVPQLGDVVVWNSWVGNPYGHISVATGAGNTNWFNSLDNNWPWALDNNYHPAAIITHNYNNVLGWLRPKGEDMAAIDDLSKSLSALYGIVDVTNKAVDGLGLSAIKQGQEISVLQTQVTEINKKLDTIIESLAKIAQAEVTQNEEIQKAASDALEALNKQEAVQKGFWQLFLDWINSLTK